MISYSLHSKYSFKLSRIKLVFGHLVQLIDVFQQDRGENNISLG
jgi:hypothetical protein